MTPEDVIPAGEPDRLAACVRALDRFLGEELEALLRGARKSLILAAHAALDLDEEDRLLSTVEEVEAVVPRAGKAFRQAVLSRLGAPGETPSDDAPPVDGADLTLVEAARGDDWPRLRQIVERHGEEARAREAGLHQRLCAAAGLPSNRGAAPLSVPGMCALFQAAMCKVDAGSEARAAIHDAFEATVVAALGELVEALHSILDAPEAGHGRAPAAEAVPTVLPAPRPDPVPPGDTLPAEPALAREMADPVLGDPPAPGSASVEPARLLGAIATVERQMLQVSTGRGLEALTELEARLIAALTPPGEPLEEPAQRAVGAVASLVQQAFAHPGIEPAVRARLWRLAPALALLALQDDDQLDLVLQSTRHDPVTGLLDRTAFRARLEVALTNPARDAGGFALCLLGVDGFEDIRRRLGQQIAGRLLRVLADLLRRRTVAAAQLARLRGAEFAVLLPARHRDTGWRFANHFLSAVNKARFAVADHAVTLTVSIGVVESDHGLTAVTEVMRAADTAHGSAQEDGGGCARIHIPEDFA